MSNDATPGFDPRFDPAFQRGFDGKAVDTPAGPAAPTLKPKASTALSEQPAPAVTIEGDDSLTLATEGVSNDDVAPRKINPYLLALGALSVILIVGGLWAAQFARESFLTVNLSTDIDYVTLQMVIFGAPLAIGIGIATAVGLLFILALRWWRGKQS